jgi:lipid-binding SYLF domain-containing protein
MSARHGRRPLIVLAMIVLFGWLTIVPGGVGVTPVRADDAADAKNLVEVSRMALETFIADAQLSEPLRAILPQAKAVLIYPQILRLAFIFGGSGGSGVLLAHDARTKMWTGPAFYTLGQFSFGLQAGGDAATIVLVALTDRGLSALLSTSAKLGADASVALGPVGGGAEAATANLSADIISYSQSKGLYAGISVNGAVVAARDGLNRAYYGREIAPSGILISRETTNPHAAPLIAAVAKAAGGK